MIDSWDDLGLHKSLELELVYELNDYEPSIRHLYVHFCKVDRAENLRGYNIEEDPWVESMGSQGYHLRREPLSKYVRLFE